MSLAVLCPLLYAHIYYLASLLSVSYIVARFASSIKCRGSVDPSMCAMQSKAFSKRAHTRGARLYFIDFGFAYGSFYFPMCKSRIVINPPKRGRLYGHIYPLVVLVIDDNAFAD